MKKIKFFTILIVSIFIFCGCEIKQDVMVNNAISVSIIDVSGAGRSEATVNVNYQQEKDYEDLYTDILIKCTNANQKVKLLEEPDVMLCIKFEEADNFYSLSKLMANAKILKTEYENYKTALSKTYILKSEDNEYDITMVAVVGELDENTNSLINLKYVSKEVTVNVKKPKN